jgi:hypothetical protein
LTTVRAISRALTLCLLLLTISAAGAPGAAAQDLSEYEQRLRLALDELATPNPDIPAVIDLLERTGPVTLPDGSTQTPDLWPIIIDLRGQPPQVDTARAQLQTLVDALSIGGAQVDPGDARTALERVLARSEFAVAEERDPTLWTRFWDWVWNGLERVLDPVVGWLDRLFSTSDPESGRGAASRVILGLIGLAFIIAVLVMIARIVRRSMMGEIVHFEDQRALMLSSAEARAEAERLLQEGNFRAALRSLYLATLLRLEEAGRLRFDRSLTNLEVLQTARVHNDALLLERLSPLVERFDRVWYGGQACTAEDYHDFARMADRAWDVEAAT